METLMITMAVGMMMSWLVWWRADSFRSAHSINGKISDVARWVFLLAFSIAILLDFFYHGITTDIFHILFYITLVPLIILKVVSLKRKIKFYAYAKQFDLKGRMLYLNIPLTYASIFLIIVGMAGPLYLR